MSKLEPIFFKILYTVRYLIPFISSLNNVNLWSRGLGLLASMLVTKGSISVVQRSRFWKALLHNIRIFCGYDFAPISNLNGVHRAPPNLPKEFNVTITRWQKWSIAQDWGKFWLIPFVSYFSPILSMLRGRYMYQGDFMNMKLPKF